MDRALEELVRRRADDRCEYCLFQVPPFHVEHIIARQHGGPSVETNLALACIRCNLHKGPNLAGIDPESATLVRLFHPRQDRWGDHFRWVGVRMQGVTPIGRATVVVLDMNHPLRLAARGGLMEYGV